MSVGWMVAALIAVEKLLPRAEPMSRRTAEDADTATVWIAAAWRPDNSVTHVLVSRE